MMATQFAIAPPAAITRILSRFEREQLAGFISVAIDLLDVIDRPRDPDAPDFSPANDDLPGSPDDAELGGDDEGDRPWIERIDQTRSPPMAAGNWADARNHEDAEDDDPHGGETTEDEPAFGKQSRRIANLLGGGGAGCPINGDRELNGDEGDHSR